MKLCILISSFFVASSFLLAPPKKDSNKAVSSHSKQEKKVKKNNDDDELLDGILSSTAHQESVKKAEQEASYKQANSDQAVKDFLKAVAMGNIALCQSLLDKGLDISKVADKEKNSPFHYVVATKVVLEKRIDKHEEISNSIKMIDFLLAHGANVNLSNNDKITPLMVAAQKNEKEILQKLLASGANINAQSLEGATALTYVALHNHVDSMKILLNAEAKDLQSPDGYTALMVAIENGKSDAARMLINETNFDLNLRDQAGDTALHFAVNFAANLGTEIEKVLEDLIRAGADLNAQETTQGWTALSYAAFYNHLSCMKILLKAGAKNLQDLHGCTALVTAIEKKNIEAAQMLINETDFDLNLRDERNYTALHCAVGLTLPTVVESLLARNADCNVFDADGDTPLMYILKNKMNRHINNDRNNIATMLLRHGADPALTRNGISDALTYAKKHKQEELAQLTKKFASKQLEQQSKLALLRRSYQQFANNTHVKREVKPDKFATPVPEISDWAESWHKILDNAHRLYQNKK